MKKILINMLTAALVAVLTAGCSNIAEGDRIYDVQPWEEAEEKDVEYDAPVAPVSRRVLIEDHTGQRCVNCPNATREIAVLQEKYGSLIVPVAIHSADLGIMEPEGLGTELGNTYYRRWNINGKPNGLINRESDGSTAVFNPTLWSAVVDYTIQQATPLDIRVKFRLDDTDTTKAKVDVKVLCTEEGASKSGKLQVWLTEDGIVAEQDDKVDGQTKNVADYVHNHVLRAAVNGDWGEDVSVSGLGDEKEFHYTLDLKAGWKAENLSIVAFVYTDQHVEQVAGRKMKD